MPYVNNVPHLGNMIGSVLSADVFARYCRSAGFETLYICGTDDHGTTTETKAIEEGLTPKEICDKYHKKHAEIYKWFKISFDHFGRTSNPVHEQITQQLFKELKEKKLVIEKETEQLYDEKAKKYLADRFVTGSCPHCDYDKAGGDQCDNCGKLLNATELKNPISKLTNTKPIIKKTKHLFICLDKLQPDLEKFVKEKKEFWTENAVKTTESWFKKGLEPRAITRDLKWGIKVPEEGYEDKVFYVWFDAPIGYISITAEYFNEDFKEGENKFWKKWWQDENTKLYQFMGKDNIPFHSIIFPATLLAAKDSWTKVHHLNSTEYLNYESGKFSKSRNVGIFGDDAINTGIPVDVWRYYMLSNRPENADTTFTWHDFKEKLNNELVANLGNLVNRTVVFINKHQKGKVGKITKRFDYATQVADIKLLYEKLELRKCLHEIMQLSKSANQYFQQEEPWKKVSETPEEAENALANLATIVKDIAILISPFLPDTAESICKQLNIEEQNFSNLGEIIEDHQIGNGEILFKKLEDKDVEKLKEQFAGKSEEAQDAGIIDLRVAEVLSIEDHPDADKLYVLKIKADRERQIVAGLRQHYTKENFPKKIVIVANLEKAKLRGQLSEGMLLAAGEKEVGLVLPPENAKAGDKVTTGTSSPKEKLDYKSFSNIKLEAINGVAHANSKKMLCNNEELKTDKGVSGKIK